MEKTVMLSAEEKHKLIQNKLNMLMNRKKQQAEAIKDKIENNQKSEIKIEQPKSQITQEKHKPQNNIQQQTKKQTHSEVPRTKHIKKPQKDKKTVLRKAAGEVWEDKTLQEWNPNDFRIFCGNLGNEVHDELLGNSFRKYSSFQKAKVIRDNRSGKSRGYGFVSFSNSKDFLRCLKQMDNKYIGSRPVKLQRSNWKDRNIDSQKNKQLPSDFSHYKKVQELKPSDSK